MTQNIITITNRDIIEKVIFKFPELVTSNAEDLIKKEYYTLRHTEEKLQEARALVRSLEGELNTLRKTFEGKSQLFDLVFNTTSKEVQSHKCNVSIKGDSVHIL